MGLSKDGKGDSVNEFTERVHVVVTDGMSSPQKPSEVNAGRNELHRKVIQRDGIDKLSKVNLVLERKESEDEEDLVDRQEELKEDCAGTSACATLYEELQECNDRVNSKEQTRETCEQELYDFVACVDHCVSETLFQFLK